MESCLAGRVTQLTRLRSRQVFSAEGDGSNEERTSSSYSNHSSLHSCFLRSGEREKERERGRREFGARKKLRSRARKLVKLTPGRLLVKVSVHIPCSYITYKSRVDKSVFRLLYIQVYTSCESCYFAVRNLVQLTLLAHRILLGIPYSTHRENLSTTRLACFCCTDRVSRALSVMAPGMTLCSKQPYAFAQTNYHSRAPSTLDEIATRPRMTTCTVYIYVSFTFSR